MDTPKEIRLWAMACHLSALIGFIIPLGNVFAPLIIWAIKRDASPYIDTQGKEALNFQITIAIAVVAAIAMTIILIGVFLLPLIGLFNIIMIIVAAVKTSNGEPFRYPLCLRLIN